MKEIILLLEFGLRTIFCEHINQIFQQVKSHANKKRHCSSKKFQSNKVIQIRWENFQAKQIFNKAVTEERILFFQWQEMIRINEYRINHLMKLLISYQRKNEQELGKISGI